MRLPSFRGLAAKALGAIRTGFGGATAGVWSKFGGNGWGKLRFLLPGSDFDWEREAGDPWRNSVVGLGLAWIGDRVARPRLKVGRLNRKGDPVELPRHGIADLWTKPNPFYGRRSLEKALVLSLKVAGDGYVYKRRDNGGRVCQLWWVPHFRCQPVWPEDGSEFISAYRISIDGFLWDVPPSDMIHIRDGIDPRNERNGLSAMGACLRELASDNGATIHTAAILKNNGVPAVALIPEEEDDIPADKETADAMAERFRDEHSGDNAGGVVVFKGKYRVEKIGYSPEELALDKLPQAAQARLASAVGVAAMSLGLNDPNKTYANLSEANRTSWGTIVSVHELIAEGIRDGLAGEPIQVNGRVTYPAKNPLDVVVWYDYSQVQELQESQDAVMTRACLGYEKGLLQRNEARAMVGEDPDPDGDVYFVEPSSGDPPPEPGALAFDGDPPADPEPEEGADDDPAGDDEDAPAKKAPEAKSWRY